MEQSIPYNSLFLLLANPNEPEGKCQIPNSEFRIPDSARWSAGNIHNSFFIFGGKRQRSRLFRQGTTLVVPQTPQDQCGFRR